MLSGCVFFSVMGVLANAAGQECDWRLVLLARSGLVTVFALSLALIIRARLAFLRPGVLWMRSLAGSCSMVATFYALTRPDFPVSNTLTLTNTFPVWVAVLSWPMVGERPTVGVWLAVLCAVAGVALTQQPHVAGFPLAAWAALAASGFTAVAMLGLNRLRGVSSLGVVVHFSAVSTLFGLSTFLFLERGNAPDHLADPTVLAMLLGVGLTATAGQVFLTLAYRSGSATKVSVVGLSQVVMVMAFEAVVHDRRFDAMTLAGTALVLGPAGWLMVRARKKPTDSAKRTDEPVVEEVAIE
jgi:drug/metabolite transporter (DMT)-like permease